MNNCEYYEKCNAPKCPLDPDMELRVERKGDKKCRYYRGTVLRQIKSKVITLGGAVPSKRLLDLIPEKNRKGLNTGFLEGSKID